MSASSKAASSEMHVLTQDATDEFNAIHSAKAKAMLNEYLIGRVAEAKAVQAKLPGIKEDEVGLLSLLCSKQSWRHQIASYLLLVWVCRMCG